MVLVVLFVIQGFSSDIGFSMVVLIRLSLHPQYKNIFLLKATVEELDYQCRNTLLFSRTSFHRYVSVKLKVIQPNDLTYSQFFPLRRSHCLCEKISVFAFTCFCCVCFYLYMYTTCFGASVCVCGLHSDSINYSEKQPRFSFSLLLSFPLFRHSAGNIRSRTGRAKSLDEEIRLKVTAVWNTLHRLFYGCCVLPILFFFLPRAPTIRIIEIIRPADSMAWIRSVSQAGQRA